MKKIYVLLMLVFIKINPLLAMMGAPAKNGQPQKGGGMSSLLVLFLPLMIIWYFLLIRPQNKRMKDHKAMLAAVVRGDEVVTSGGLIGKVTKVMLGEDDRARVYLQIPNEVVIYEDTVASVRTQGIIGDKYIRIIPGGSDEILRDGDFITETESAIDIEEMVSKYIFGDV